MSIRRSIGELGLEVRVGLHAGECERVGRGLRGVAVHVGARIGATAEPGEVLVSSTVRDLVAGSGIAFEDAGRHQLKGVPEAWHLYRVSGIDES
jgi:class 3 adenylate cyclase